MLSYNVCIGLPSSLNFICYPKEKHAFLTAPKCLTANSSSCMCPTNSLLYSENNKLKIPHCVIFFNQPLFHLFAFQRRGTSITHLTTTGKTVQELVRLSLGSVKFLTGMSKGKVIPLQVRCGPEGG